MLHQELLHDRSHLFQPRSAELAAPLINDFYEIEARPVVAITKGKLDLGPWEQIFYGEFDGKRRKRVLVKIIGE